jgi:hypothetical protein
VATVVAAEPELPEGLAVRRVALDRENERELAWPHHPFPAGASPVEGFMLEPTNGIVEDVFEDDRFVSVYVEDATRHSLRP